MSGRRIQKSKYAQVIRTDFSNDAAWNRLKAEIVKPSKRDGFVAMVGK